jgi:hypothetical protein
MNILLLLTASRYMQHEHFIIINMLAGTCNINILLLLTASRYM